MLNWMFIVYFALVFATGIAIGIFVRYGREKAEVKTIVEEPESWCMENCKTYQRCHENHDDPDDAWKELDDYCSECPICYAQLILMCDNRKYRKWRKQHDLLGH